MRRKNKIVLFAILFFVCTLFKANHFVKLEKINQIYGVIFKKSFALENFSRFAMLQERNFLLSYKKPEYSFEGLEKWKNIYSEKNIERLSKCKKFYNLRQPHLDLCQIKQVLFHTQLVKILNMFIRKKAIRP